MDQIIVDVGDEPVETGEEVILIGRQGEQQVSADEWASMLGTISYEVVCQIGPRLPRRYES
jgi:alanine racemase